MLKKSNLILKYPYKGLSLKKTAYNKYFSYSFYVFSLYKAREINRHFPCNPGLSKHFFETKTKLADAQTVVFIPKKSRHFILNYKDYYI